MKVYEEEIGGGKAAADRYPDASVLVIVDWHKPFTFWQLLRAWWNGRVVVHPRKGVQEVDVRYSK